MKMKRTDAQRGRKRKASWSVLLLEYFYFRTSRFKFKLRLMKIGKRNKFGVATCRAGRPYKITFLITFLHYTIKGTITRSSSAVQGTALCYSSFQLSL